MAKSQKNKSKRYMKHLLNAGLAFLSFTITGCSKDLYEPPVLNESKIQVKEEAFLQDVAMSEVNAEFIAALAHHHNKHGGSTMDLLVTYDPRSYRNTAMNATNSVADIAAELREHGVTNVKAGVMPIKSQGDEARLLVSYDSLTAHAPEGCDYEMPGMNGAPLEHDEKYKYGCGIDTLLARQIAKPGDLLGRGQQDDTTDGRAAANIVELYRTGAQNEPLEGESATDE